jgi:hypothetical protein
MLDRNRRYYAQFPKDRDRVRAIHERLETDEGILSTGERLTGRRFRQLGHGLGMSDGAERLHHLVELPVDSPAFRHDVAAASPFPRNPLYALLHEASVADGATTGWSAERVMPEQFAEDVALFTGESVHPWMFEDVGELRPFAEAAHLLARRQWPRLYDPDRLSRNEVPVAAAVYAEDPYVPSVFSLATASALAGARVWLTNEYDHNGLRAGGGRILSRLMDMGPAERDDGAARSGESLDSRVAVVVGVEAQDRPDVVAVHDREVQRVASGEPVTSQDDALGGLDLVQRHREDLVHDAEERVERRLDRVEAVHSRVAAENLLQHLGVRHETFSGDDEIVQSTRRASLVRMFRPDQVHRHVRVDEDGHVRYPRSISAFIWSISPVGKLWAVAARTAASLRARSPDGRSRCAARRVRRTHSETVSPSWVATARMDSSSRSSRRTCSRRLMPGV